MVKDAKLAETNQVSSSYVSQTGRVLVRGFCCNKDALPLLKLDKADKETG